eukprot:Skav216032  [mRNA]  locus=scaffold2403:21316:24672:+ [translate_table: standard]
MACVHDQVNVGWTASFPCQPFSRANRCRTGINHEGGRVFFDVCKWARFARPLFVGLENVDEISSGEHMSIIKCFIKWAGYVLHWTQVHDHVNIAPCHRRRWLAVMVRADVARDEPLILPQEFRMELKDGWNHDMYKFPIPQSMNDQLNLPENLFHAYGVTEYLPPAKRPSGDEPLTFQEVLKLRLTDEHQDLPTLVANYSSQHLLPIKHVSKAGLYADLVLSEQGVFQFQSPIRWAALLGNVFELHLPQSVKDMFHQLGNAICVPQAALALLVALDAIDIHDKFFSIIDDALDVWKSKLTADFAVCFENAHGYSVMHVGDFLKHHVSKCGLNCIDAKHEMVIRWDNGATTTCQFPLGAETFRLFMCIGIPPHLLNLFAVVDAEGNTYFGHQILPLGLKTVKLLFLPAAKHMVPRGYGEKAISATLKWEPQEEDDDEEKSPLRRVSQRTALMINMVVSLPNGEDRDVTMPDYATFRDVMLSCGFDVHDLPLVEVWNGSNPCLIEDNVASFSDAHITVTCRTLRHVDVKPDHKVIEVIKPTGFTVFLECDQTQSIRQRLLDAAFPEALVNKIKATMNGRIIPMDTMIWDCDAAPIRLRAFPLKGGGAPSSAKGGSKGSSDPLQADDPWAGKRLQPPKIGVRWDQLKLVDNHPFYCKTSGSRLNQVSVLQLGPQQSGIVFTTKTGLMSIEAVSDKGTTVVLLPAAKGVGEIGHSDKFTPLKPRQIMVKDSTTSTPYMRLVLPVLLKGELDFKVHEPSNVISVDASPFCEMLIEVHSAIMSQPTFASMTEHPLEGLKRIVAGIGIPMTEVAVYSHRHLQFHDDHGVHQAVLKVPSVNLVTMLNVSGKGELFTRQYITEDTKPCHSVIPRFWPITLADLRKALQLGQSLEDGFRGIALSRRGLAIRCDNKIIAKARSTIMQGDARFTSVNSDVVVRVTFLAQGFPFQLSHDAIINATKQGTGIPPVPLRSFRMAGLLTWILGFETAPTTLQFAIKLDGAVHEVLLSPQENSKPSKQVKKQLNDKKGGRKENFPPKPPRSVTSMPQAPLLNQDDARISALEKKVATLEVNQSKLSDRMDGRFDQMANQLQQVLAAVSGPSSHSGRARPEGPSGETPPPKDRKTS